MPKDVAEIGLEVETAADAVAREDAWIEANERRLADEEFGAAVLQEAFYRGGN